MNTVVNWFLLMIIFVFDPLAIALVVAANMAFTMNRPKDIKMSVPEGMEFNKPYPMPKSWLDPEDEEYDDEIAQEELVNVEMNNGDNSADDDVACEEITLSVASVSEND